MSTFDDIRKAIQADIEAKNGQEPTPVAGRVIPEINDDGTPKISPVRIVGTLVSKPGTEKVLLDASTFQFMECVTAAKGQNKPRYCIVEKGTTAKYGNQFINSSAERVHVVTKELFTLMFSVINNASKQIRTLSSDMTKAKEEVGLYKMTIDALRKNGVID